MALEKTYKVIKKLTKVEDDEIRLYYNNLVLYHLVKVNNKAFMDKIFGDIDEFGKKWKPLKPRTIRQKKRKNQLYGGRVAINIRTRALREAIKPGRFINGRYIPREGQFVEVTTTSITFGIDIDYAENVHSRRKILVPSKEGIIAAKKSAAPQFEAYLRRRGLL